MQIDPFKIFNNGWALVTAGTKDDFNTMTVSWGSLGTLWNKPIATVYIKPCRYTYKYLEREDYFTVSFYDEKYREDLMILGTKSKRDTDKLALTKLTPYYLETGITFKEAKCTLVLKKIYYDDLKPDRIPKEYIERYYKEEAPHRLYIGEVIDIIE